jgi:signal transduction histidine kinase
MWPSLTLFRTRPLPAALLGAYAALALATWLLAALAWSTPGYGQTVDETVFLAAWPALFLAYPLVGALVAARHPDNAVGWLFCAVGLLWGLNLLATAWAAFGLKAHPGALPGAVVANWLGSWTFFPALGLTIDFVPLLFPNGRLPGPRWRIVAGTGAVGIALATAGFAFAPGPLSDGLGGSPNPFGILPPAAVDIASALGFPLVLASAIAAATAMVRRLRQARGAEREQLSWIAFAASILAAGFVVHLALQFSGADSAVPWYGVVWGAALCGIPVAAGIAILRRGLFDIDLVINRTLVYAVLTALVAGGYVLVVTASGVLLRAEGSLLPALLATGLIAVAFQPLRERVQRAVNRLLYGERDDPYAVLSRLGRRLEGALAPDEILPAIVRTLAETLRLPYAAIVLPGGDLARPAAFAGVPVADAPGAGVVRLPLVYQTEPVGELVVAPRDAGEAFGPADRRLLEDLARQIGVAAHAVRLTADLQRSRQQIVTAREEERRRLRRDLHDGLGAQLAALAMQAGGIRAMIARDPRVAAEQAADLRTELRSAVADIRRLVHGLRPPALDELGLVGALRQRAAAIGVGGPGDADGEAGGLAVSVAAPDDLPTLPAAVEVAALRIADEAVANAARHARARHCRVSLAVAGGALRLVVEDDGVGIPPDRVAGVGLLSMRERADELGGTLALGPRDDGPGTRLEARLPLPPAAPPAPASGPASALPPTPAPTPASPSASAPASAVGGV